MSDKRKLDVIMGESENAFSDYTVKTLNSNKRGGKRHSGWSQKQREKLVLNVTKSQRKMLLQSLQAMLQCSQ